MTDRTETNAGPSENEVPRWYACQVMSRAEKKAARYLVERGIETFVPMMSVVNQWKDRKKVVEVPLFRGYLFARFVPSQYGGVLRVPGVATVVRHNGAPASIPDREIENVRRLTTAIEAGDVDAEPVHRIGAGQRVRILAKPFDGNVEGVVVDLGAGRSVDVFVGVQLIGQFIRMKVRVDELEPLPPVP
jgi:transcription antitermination factor NusG